MRRVALLATLVVFVFSFACGGGGSSTAPGLAGTSASNGPWKSLGMPLDDASSVVATDKALAITYTDGTVDERTEALEKPLEARGWTKSSDIGGESSGRVVTLTQGGASISIASSKRDGQVMVAVSLTGDLPAGSGSAAPEAAPAPKPAPKPAASSSSSKSSLCSSTYERCMKTCDDTHWSCVTSCPSSTSGPCAEACDDVRDRCEEACKSARDDCD